MPSTKRQRYLDKKKKKKTIMHKLKIKEISAVNKPAQQGALATIMKSDNAEESFEKGRYLLTDPDSDHSHIIEISGYAIEHGGGDTSWNQDHYHPFIINDDGSIRIGETRGHTHTISSEMLKNLENHLAEIGENSIEEENPMSKNDEKDQASVALEKAEKQLQDTQKEVETLKSIMSLSPEHKAHYDSLDEDTQKSEFLAKSDSEKESELNLSKGDDPVVYKSDKGQIFRKSDDPRLVEMAKDADADKRELKKVHELNENLRLEKRAETELKHLPGEKSVQVALLKAVECIENKADREGVEALLKSHNEKMSKAFNDFGKNDESADMSDSDELNSYVEKHAKEKGLSIEKAYSEVLKTSEGQALYNKIHQQ